MERSTQQIQQIEAYMNEKMSSEEKADFEKKLEQDQTLAHDVQLYRLEKRAAQLLLEEEFSAQIRQYRQGKSTDDSIDHRSTKPIVSLWKRRLAVAASILILIAASTLFWSSSNYSNSALVSAQFQYDFSGITRNIQHNNDNNAVLGQATKLFKADDIQEAIALLNATSASDSTFIETQYYLGQLYYRQQEFSKAVDRFDKVLASNDFRFREQAEWYLILSMLADGQTGDSFTILLDEVASNEASVCQLNARQLQQRMQSFWRMLIF